MKKHKKLTNEEFQRMIDQRNYKLTLWERERKDIDLLKIKFEQWDYYLREEDSFCVLSFYQKNLNDEIIEDYLEENLVEIEFETKEEVIEFFEKVLEKLKYFIINLDDYKLEKEKKK